MKINWIFPILGLGTSGWFIAGYFALKSFEEQSGIYGSSSSMLIVCFVVWLCIWFTAGVEIDNEA